MSEMKSILCGIKSRLDTAGQRQANLKIYQWKQFKIKHSGKKNVN